jgi:hypothetical protein
MAAIWRFRYCDPRQLRLKLRPRRNPVPQKPTYRDLRKLQDEWDRRLKAEGFNDIENRHFGAPGAPSWIDKPSTDLLERYDESTAEYYRAAEAFKDYLQDRPLLVQKIWELHAQGVSQIAIMRALKLARRRAVRTQLEKLRAEMLAWWRDQPPPDDGPLDEQSDEQVIALMFEALSGVPLEDES